MKTLFLCCLGACAGVSTACLLLIAQDVRAIRDDLREFTQPQPLPKVQFRTGESKPETMLL